MAAQYASEHQKTIHTIAAKAPKSATLKKTFIEEFYAPIQLGVLKQMQPDRAYDIADYCLQTIKTRTSGKPIIHLEKTTVHVDGVSKECSRLLVANDDMPFLVDSISMVLNQLHLKSNIMLHPVVHVQRNAAGIITHAGKETNQAESYIYVELAPFPKGTTPTQLKNEIAETLKAVRASVEDWHSMEDAIEDVLVRGDVAPNGIVGEESGEIKDFIRWLHDKNFVFLGHAVYHVTTAKTTPTKNKSNGDKQPSLKIEPEKSLGLFKLYSSNTNAVEFSTTPIGDSIITITKANNMSPVHRLAHMDLVVIKHFERDGSLRGETRFLGLFTSNVYYQSAIAIPIIRLKIGKVLMRAGYKPTSHSGKALRTIFEFLPRDELFLMSEDALFDVGIGVLSAESYPQVRLFMRQDPFKRHVSALIYIPRERFSSSIREEITTMLQANLKAELRAFYAQISDSPLARLHVVLDTQSKSLDYDITDLESTIAALVNNWADGLKTALLEAYPNSEGEALAARYADAFPNAYIYSHDTSSVTHDIRKIESCIAENGVELELFRTKHDAPNHLHLKCFTKDTDAALSDIFPLLENMGLNVRDVVPYTISPAGADAVLMRDFTLSLTQESPLSLAEEKPRIEEALHQIWRGNAANDSMNTLLFLTKVDWRDIAMLRGYVRYLQQINFPYRLGYMSRVLAKHHNVTRLLVDFFQAKFTPNVKNRDSKLNKLRTDIHNLCDSITNLAEDRVLQRVLALMEATLRTNFFLTDEHGEVKPYISFKFASAEIPELPLPRPYAEIFVTSGRMEGVHLRGDKVARGGLRWSDRAEDFRTEVLGLVKAQMVKNAVIVPEGAKGGFVLRRPPSDRDALQEEGIACYKQFLSGLLDITDNIVDGKVVPPAQVVRHDGDDPYLVVAADKGTATFSDIANSVAASYNFWLGDAFASGGSAGYDHKLMGITARGAWVSVERHFEEMGHDIAKKPFTAVGIGDMGGDVFGNGMLLSKNLKLIAAFNHRHIFVDPDPDPATSYKERQRLFKGPKSAWSDYDKKLLSKGGDVFERQAKSVTLTKEMRAALGTDATSLAPDELIKIILKAPVDLIWNGGIGTYVKATDETHDQVGDRSNNAVRVNGKELRAKIMAEGGNLGFTQRGRIEYARHGGRLNTDAIDNSAGVDCSDHEVNIKIVLNAVMSKKKITLKARNELLKDMTNDVAELSLNDNRLQTQAISMAEHYGSGQLEPITQLMHQLEDEGTLNRAVEFLPEDKQIEELRAQNLGLSRPEIAVMLAYSKLALYRDIKSSPLLDDDYFAHDLMRYFPTIFQEKFKRDILEHPLRREIIATMATNSLINRTGITFAHELKRETGLRSDQVTLSYLAVRDIFRLRDVWQQIEALTGDAAKEQMRLFQLVNQFIAHHCRWLLNRYRDKLNIADVNHHYSDQVAKLDGLIESSLNPTMAHNFNTQKDNFIAAGVPKALATQVARMEAMRSSLDIIEIAETADRSLEQVASLYFEMGSRLKLNWIRQLARLVPVETYWQRQAVTTLKNELYGAQRRITTHTLQCFSKKPSGYCLEQWFKKNEEALTRYQKFIEELELMAAPDFATLTVALRQVQNVTAG